MNESSLDRRYRFVIVGLLLWANFAFGLSFAAMAPILPVITEHYEISHTMAGLLVGVIFIIEATFGLPGGVIVGWLGQRRSYAISFFMMGAGTLTALSPSFEGLLALRIAYGFAIALFLPATATLLMQLFRPRVLPLIFGLGTASISVGFVVSTATVAPLSDIIGWERALGLYGAVGLGVAVAWLFLGKGQEGVGRVLVGPTLVWREVSAMMRNRTLVLIVTSNSAVFGMLFMLSAWLPTFYVETRGWSLAEGGFIISLIPFVGIFGLLLGGSLPLKIRSKRLFFIVPGAMAGLGGLGTFLVGDTTITYLSMILLGLGAYIFVPIGQTMPMEQPGMTPQRIALYWGCLMTLAGIGQFIAPIVVGAMADSLGTFKPGFLLFCVVGWWRFVAGFLLPKTTPQKGAMEDFEKSGNKSGL